MFLFSWDAIAVMLLSLGHQIIIIQTFQEGEIRLKMGPLFQKTPYCTIVLNISSPKSKKKLWTLWYQSPYPWYCLGTFTVKSKITLTVFWSLFNQSTKHVVRWISIGLRSVCVGGYHIFQNFEDWVRVTVFILNFHSWIPSSIT